MFLLMPVQAGSVGIDGGGVFDPLLKQLEETNPRAFALPTYLENIAQEEESGTSPSSQASKHCS